MTLEWKPNPECAGLVYDLHGLPLWHYYGGDVPVAIWIETRPGYCDRGRYHAMTDAPLDNQEGWPRYYFDLETAKREVIEWVKVRKEFRGA